VVKPLTTGSSVEISGKLVESPGKGQRVELQGETVTIYGAADAETYPLQKKRHSFEFLRTLGHLRSRTNTLGAVFRVRNACAQAIHQFFQERGFMWMHTPIITASDCEGAGEMFAVTGLDLTKVPLTKDRRGGLQPGLLWQTRLPDGERPAGSGNHGHGLHQCLYLWPHLSGRKLQHLSPPGGVLDGGARNGLLRPGGQHGPGRRLPQVPVLFCGRAVRRRYGVFQQAHRRYCAGHRRQHYQQHLRAHHLHRSGEAAGKGRP
jgi:hypothetical protein